MFAPKIQGIAPFGKELVTLIDSGHAGDGAGLMVEDLVGDVRRNAESCHTAYSRPP